MNKSIFSGIFPLRVVRISKTDATFAVCFIFTIIQIVHQDVPSLSKNNLSFYYLNDINNAF